MTDAPQTTNPSKDYLLGFYAAIKAAINCIPSLEEPMDTHLERRVRARATEAISGLKP